MLVRRILYSGQQLQGDRTFLSYNVEKESTIQIMCGKRDPQQNDGDGEEDGSQEEAENLERAPLQRQKTAAVLQFGDILVVTLKYARNLVAKDWNGTSDPYCVLAIQDQSVKSQVVKRNLNPHWEEEYVFFLDPTGAMTEKVMKKRRKLGLFGKKKKKKKKRDPGSDQALSISCYDRDFLTKDDDLG